MMDRTPKPESFTGTLRIAVSDSYSGNTFRDRGKACDLSGFI